MLLVGEVRKEIKERREEEEEEGKRKKARPINRRRHI